MDALKRKSAERRIENFKQQAGPSCFHLACHAAVPMAFTPDLLYCLWSNFRSAEWPDWLGVAEVLLSSLCKEVSYELFEMDTVVQELLRQELEQRWGRDRVREVARFVLEYVAHEQERTLEADLAEAQRWVALAFIDPDDTLAQLRQALQQPNADNHWRILNLQEVLPRELRPHVAAVIEESRARQVEVQHIEVKANSFNLSISFGKMEIKLSEPITGFVAGGILNPDNPTYIVRQADKELFEACLKGQFAFVLASRQIGKSSLIARMIKNLRHENIDTVWVDLYMVGIPKGLDYLYFSILNLIKPQLKHNLNVEVWWKYDDTLSSDQRFNQFLEKEVLPGIDKMLVIFLDEIDFILELQLTDYFMANIRFLYDLRVTKNIFEKITFVVMGVATPSDMINNPLRSPFNIGKQIELVDFTKVELEPYRITLINQHPQYGNQYFEDIFAWVNGHPHLTQNLCSLVFESPISDNKNLVDEVVQKNIILPKGNNITIIQNSLIKHEFAREMLEVYQHLVSGKIITDYIKSSATNQLKLTGMVVSDKGILRIRNKLYATVFDKEWVDAELSKINSSMAYYRTHGYISEDEIVPESYQRVFNTVDTLSTFMVILSDQLKLEVITNGQGSPLILFQPAFSAAPIWKYQVDFLSKQFRVIIIHYPGYARSTMNYQFTSPQNIADLAEVVLDLMGINEAIDVIGWSMGGMIAQCFAQKYGYRVKTLTLVNTTANMKLEDSPENRDYLLLKLEDDFHANFPERLRSHKQYYRKLLEIPETPPTPSLNLHYLGEMLKFNSTDWIHEISVPTLVIQGTKDQLIPPEQGHFIAHQIKSSDFFEFTESGHYTPLQHHEAFNQVWLDFWTRQNNSHENLA